MEEPTEKYHHGPVANSWSLHASRDYPFKFNNVTIKSMCASLLYCSWLLPDHQSGLFRSYLNHCARIKTWDLLVNVGHCGQVKYLGRLI